MVKGDENCEDVDDPCHSPLILSHSCSVPLPHHKPIKAVTHLAVGVEIFSWARLEQITEDKKLGLV